MCSRDEGNNSCQKEKNKFSKEQFALLRHDRYLDEASPVVAHALFFDQQSLDLMM